MKYLPKEIEIPKEVVAKEKENINAVVDYLSDIYGFCIFSLEVVKRGKKFYAVNIKWDITN